MSNRYPSVDRKKEIKLRKNYNPKYSYGSLILEPNGFDINRFLSEARNISIKSNNSKKSYPKKLPSISKKILNPQIFDIISKSTNLSTEGNNGFSFEKDNKEKRNFNYIKTDLNNDIKSKYYYNAVISSNLTERSSINNTAFSSESNFIKPIVIKENVSPTPLRNYPNERLYSRHSSQNQITHSHFLKLIKEIKHNNLNMKNKKLGAVYKKLPIRKNKIAYDTRYENVVFDANDIINKFKYNEHKNKLKVSDDDMNEFISKNKQISKNNVLIELMLNENKKLKIENDIRKINIRKSAKIIEKNEMNFDHFTSKQRDIYFKLSDILNKIQEKNMDLMKLLYNYKTREKTLEDEIFKIIEQIESIRIYAKFIHKVLGGDIKMFEGELIPDYKNDNRPDINLLINKVYKKYGNLIKNHKLSLSTNSNNSEGKENNYTNTNDIKLEDKDNVEEIDIDLLDDPYIIIKKFKELEDKIIYLVKNREIFYKNKMKEDEENEEIINYMNHRFIKLEKEYKVKKRELINYKKDELGTYTQDTLKGDLFVAANDLCNIIYECFNNDKKNKKKAINIDILELNDEMKKCYDIMVSKEALVNKFLEEKNFYEKNDQKIFNEIMYQRKLENKKSNQNKNRENIKNNELLKKNKADEKLNKIIIKKRKCEPPLYFEKKEIKYKEDINTKIKKENEELLKYK